MPEHQHVINNSNGIGIQNNLTINAPKILPSNIFAIWHAQPFSLFMLKLTPGFLLLIYYVNNLHKLDFGLLVLCTFSIYANYFLFIFFVVSKNAKILTYQNINFFEYEGELINPCDFYLDLHSSKKKAIVLQHKTIETRRFIISFIFKKDFWIIKGSDSFIAWFFDEQKKNIAVNQHSPIS